MIDLKLTVRRPGAGLAPLFSWGMALLALGSGLIMALAVPPLNLWPLAWVALAPLWIVVLMVRQPGWIVFLYGLIWGIGFYGSTLSWITSLHPLTWMGVPWLGSVAIAAFAWSFVTLWGAGAVGLWAFGLVTLARWQPLPPSLRVLAGTTLWCLLELLRNQTPLDWSTLALTQSPNNLWILQLSQLSGQTLVTAILVGVNGLLAETVWHYIHLGPPSAVVRRGRSLWVSALVLTMAAHGVGATLFAHTPENDPANEIRIGLIQGNVPTRIKLTPAGIHQAVAGYLEGYQTLVAEGVDAVLTPEGAIPAIWNSETSQTKPLVRAVQQAGVPLWLGIFATDRQHPSYAHVTQSLVEINAQGQASGQYNKVQLVPLGEYIPFQHWLGPLIGRLSPLDSYLIPGDPQQQFVTALGPAIVGICYESAYGHLFRGQTRQGGEFILTASNNDPYPSRMMAQHHALDVIRAIESDRWAVRATNTGISGLVDSQGRTHWLAPAHTYLTHTTTLYRRQSLTPYVRWGTWIVPVLLGLSLVCFLTPNRWDCP